MFMFLLDIFYFDLHPLSIHELNKTISSREVLGNTKLNARCQLYF